MSLCTNPDDMCADERLEEVASILARGVTRLHGRLRRDVSEAEISEGSSQTGLDLCATSRPDRVTG